MERLINPVETERFARILDDKKRIVLTCHVRPDGDAIGSTLGLAALFQKLGKEAKVVVPDMPPRNLSFLSGFKDIAVYSQYETYCKRIVDECDLIVCLDFNVPSRQDHLAPLIQGSDATKVLIDHHQNPSDFCDLTMSYPKMSSTCELAFRIIADLGLYGELDLDAATCLLTGIITDTRNFTVNCQNPDIYEILMRLLDKGADKEAIVKKALMTVSYWSLKLKAYALSEKLEVFDRHHAALITLDKDELKRFHYERGDTEGLVNEPLDIRGMAYSIFMREDDDCVKVSARSVDGFPVSKICEDLFNGGGHLQAAGGEFYGPLETCREKLINAMADYDRFLPADIEKISR